MARPFAFESWVEDGLHTYRHVARDVPIVEHNWSGLFGEWPEVGRTPYTEYAVNNNNCEEVAVYLGLIWRLTSDLMLYGVPRYDRDHATRRSQGRLCGLVGGAAGVALVLLAASSPVDPGWDRMFLLS